MLLQSHITFSFLRQEYDEVQNQNVHNEREAKGAKIKSQHYS